VIQLIKAACNNNLELVTQYLAQGTYPDVREADDSEELRACTFDSLTDNPDPDVEVDRTSTGGFLGLLSFGGKSDEDEDAEAFRLRKMQQYQRQQQLQSSALISSSAAAPTSSSSSSASSFSRDSQVVKKPKNEGCTPLMRAAQRGYLEVVRVLLDGGARIFVTDNVRMTECHQQKFSTLESVHAPFVGLLFTFSSEQQDSSDACT
jgi:ankyrin repeat protein